MLRLPCAALVALSLGACGAAVQPMDGGSREVGSEAGLIEVLEASPDGASTDGNLEAALGDGSALCPSTLHSCTSDVECSRECSGGICLHDYTSMGSDRDINWYSTCIGNASNGIACRFDVVGYSSSGGHRPYLTPCFTAPRVGRLGPSTAIPREQCARLRSWLQSTMPGRVVDERCIFQDQTEDHGGPLPQARCMDAPMRTCGEGCAPCPGMYEACLFVSERYGTGICRSTVLGCGPTVLCAQGNLCLTPLRGDDTIPDSQRMGLCLPAADCQSLAAALPDGYTCRPYVRP